MLTHNNVKLKNITYNGQKVKKWNHNGVRIYNAGSTVTYYVDTNTAYTEEVDSEASCLSPKTFTPTKSGWNFVGWRENNTASSEILTDKIMGDSPITLYAVFKQDVTCTFISNGTQTATGTRYYNNNNVADASVTAPSGQVYSGWTWRGWSAAGDTTAAGTVAYNNGSTISGLTSNATFYGLHYLTLTLTYYNGSATASSTSGYRYYNAAGNYSNPSFTMTQAVISGWTARGWAMSSAAEADIMHKNGDTITLTGNATIYGCYQRTLTLSYAGNGATSGGTAAQTGTQYFNSGNYGNPSFILRANGFTRTDYSFSKWAIGSASGTQYAAGASVTLSANTTFYAVWTSNAFYWIQNGVVQSGYPSEFVVSYENFTNIHGDTSITNFKFIGKEEGNTRRVASTSAVNTKGNKYMDITFGSWCTLNGVIDSYTIAGTNIASQLKGDNSGSYTITIDVSKVSTVSIYIDATAWAWGNWITLPIYSIRFYS